MQVGTSSPLPEPPSLVRDVGGASPPPEIRTPGHPRRSQEGGAPRFRGDPGSGASLRVWLRVWRSPGLATHTLGRSPCLRPRAGARGEQAPPFRNPPPDASGDSVPPSRTPLSGTL